jgi:hypothetical protein
VFGEFERQNFVEECGVVAYLVVQTLMTSRPQITPFLRWRDHRYPGQPLDEEMLAEYLHHASWERHVQPAYLMSEQ